MGCIEKWPPKMSLHTVIQAFQHPGEAERYAGCFSFIVSPNKPISYKLFPYLSCHSPASQKNSRKTKCELQTSHFPRTMCHTKEREREIKGRRAGGKAGKSRREAEEMLPRDLEGKKKEGGTFRCHRGEEL